MKPEMAVCKCPKPAAVKCYRCGVFSAGPLVHPRLCMPCGSSLYSDLNAASISSRMQCRFPRSSPPQIGISGQTFKFPHFPTNFLVQESHSKTYPLLLCCSMLVLFVLDPRRTMLLMGSPPPATSRETGL